MSTEPRDEGGPAPGGRPEPGAERGVGPDRSRERARELDRDPDRERGRTQELDRDPDRERGRTQELDRHPDRDLDRGQAGYRPHRPRAGDAPWLTRVILAATLLVVFSAGTVIAASRLPLWWSRRMSAVADGTYAAGVFAGLACGIAFTLLPLLVWRGMLRRRVPWRGRVWLLAAGLALALPNLMTLGIVIGNDANASAARSAVDAGAPGFRGASLAGALIGGLLAVAVWVLLAWLRRSRRRILELESQLRRAAEGADGPAEGSPERAPPADD